MLRSRFLTTRKRRLVPPLTLFCREPKQSNPNVKVILPHAGGTLAFLVPRVFAFESALRTAEQRQDDFRSFYFDTALSSSNGQLRALSDVVVDPTHIFLAATYRMLQSTFAKLTTTRLDDFFSDEEYKHPAQNVDWENALALFPPFSKATL
ncbi:unnamed protein product [Umbelopsis ramanniana]